MEKFKPQSPDPYLKKDADMSPAKFGHLNAIVENINETKRPYKVYSVLLTQTDDLDPVIVVLENTLGVTLTCTRTSDGSYSFSGLASLTTDPNKVYLSILPITDGEEQVTGPQNLDARYFATLDPGDLDSIFVFTRNNGFGSDGMLSRTPFEIRVY